MTTAKENFEIGELGEKRFCDWLVTQPNYGAHKRIYFKNEPEEQYRGIDIRVKFKDLTYTTTFEIKTERSSFTGNYFIERWSNRSINRDGWAVKCQANILIYCFLDNKIFNMFSVNKIKKWTQDWDNSKDMQNEYPLVLQRATQQRNDTWGILVKREKLCELLDSIQFQFRE